MATGLKEKLQEKIWKFVDFFYPPFQRYFSLLFFRYGFMGGFNLVIDWVWYYLIYHFIFRGNVWELGFVAFSPHIATLVLKWPITFATGFWLQRNITFSKSNLTQGKQFFRYFVVTVCNTFLVYGGLKCFVDFFHIMPVLSYIMISVISVFFSYFFNRYFSFQTLEDPNNKANENADNNQK